MDSKRLPCFNFDSIKADVSRISEVLKSEEDDYSSNVDIQSEHSNDVETTEPPLEHTGERGSGDNGEGPVVIKPADCRVPDENFDVALRNCAELKDSIMKSLQKLDDIVDEIDQKQVYLTTKLEIATKLECEEKKKIKYYKPINLFSTPYFRDVRGSVPSPNEDSIMKKLNGDIDAYIAPPRPWTAPERRYLRDAVVMNARRQVFDPLTASRDYYTGKMARDILPDEQVAEIEEKLEAIRDEIEDIKRKPDEEVLRLERKLDWMRISASLTDISRTPDQCERMWRNYVHPAINKKKWTEEEDNELRKIAAKHKYRDWVQIASELTLSKRTAIQCLQRYQSALNNNMLKSIWTPEDDKELLDVVESCKNGNYIPWNQVSYHIDGRRRLQIVNRWTRSIAPNLKKAPWSPEEDAILLAAVDKYGYKWAKIKDLLPGRSNFACRERYTNVLAPGVVVGNWSQEEDRLLIKLAKQYPEGKWSKIAEHFEGRTDNMCLQRVTRIRKYHPHLFDPSTPFSDIEDDLETAVLVTPTHNCKALNANRENIRLAAEESLTKSIMKVRGYKTMEEATEAIKSMKASRTFLFQLSRELLSEEGKNAHKRKPAKKAEEKSPAKRKRVVRKNTERTKTPKKRIKRARQVRRSELFDESDSETETDAMSFHDEDEEEEFSERRGESEEEFCPEKTTDVVNHKRTEEDERVDEELDSLFLPVLLYGFRQVKKSKCVYQSARHVLEHKLLKSSIYEAMDCAPDDISDEEEESHEGTKIRGIDYGDSVPHVFRNFVFDFSFQEGTPVFPPNHLSLHAFKFLLINYKQLQQFLSQIPCQDTHIISLISSREIYTLVCASCYKRRIFEPQSDVVVNVPEFSPDWTEEDQNKTNSAESAGNSELCNGEPKDNEISCVECERLNTLRREYHLLRKRLFSLFFWPALLTMTAPTDKQKDSVGDQDTVAKTRSRAPVKKCAGRKRQRSRSRGRRRAQSVTEQEAASEVEGESQAECAGRKRQRSRSRGRTRAQSEAEEEITPEVRNKSQSESPPPAKKRKCAPKKVEKATKSKCSEVLSVRATRKSPRNCR